MGKIRITQVKSGIHRPQNQKDTLRALGITKNYHSVEKESTPQVLGMINTVKHLVTVKEI